MTRRRLLLLSSLLVLAGCSGREQDDLLLTGVMEATTVRVSAQMPGQLLDVLVDEGQQVTTGQLIARVDTTRLGHQLGQQSAVVDELAAQARVVEQQIAAARAARDNLRLRLDRFRGLRERQAVTQQQVDDLTAQVDAAEAQLRAAEEQRAVLQGKRAQVNAAAEVLRTQVRDTRITAPLTGTVLVRFADAGEIVAPGSPVCDIADLSTLWTRIYIEEQFLPRITLGMPVRIRIDGLPDTLLTGTITWISSKAEFTPKTILTEETRASLVFAAKVTVANPAGILKIGMPVSVLLPRRAS